MFSKLYFTDNSFTMFSGQHFFTLLLIMVFIYRFVYLDIEKRSDVHYILLGLALLQQVLLYSWYYASHQFDFVDALPLYPCRLLQLFNIVLLLKDSEKLYEILYLLGIPSAIMALIIADTGGNGLPSAMFIQFFLGHTLMILIPVYIGKKRQYVIHHQSMGLIAKIMGIYFVVVSLVNQTLNSNYGYLQRPPGDLIINGLPLRLIYLVGYFLLYLALVKAWLLVSKILSHKFKKIGLVFGIE